MADKLAPETNTIADQIKLQEGADASLEQEAGDHPDFVILGDTEAKPDAQQSITPQTIPEEEAVVAPADPTVLAQHSEHETESLAPESAQYSDIVSHEQQLDHPPETAAGESSLDTGILDTDGDGEVEGPIPQEPEGRHEPNVDNSTSAPEQAALTAMEEPVPGVVNEATEGPAVEQSAADALPLGQAADEPASLDATIVDEPASLDAAIVDEPASVDAPATVDEPATEAAQDGQPQLPLESDLQKAPEKPEEVAPEDAAKFAAVGLGAVGAGVATSALLLNDDDAPGEAPNPYSPSAAPAVPQTTNLEQLIDDLESQMKTMMVSMRNVSSALEDRKASTGDLEDREMERLMGPSTPKLSARSPALSSRSQSPALSAGSDHRLAM